MVTHYFHPSKESKRIKSVSSKQHLLTKRPPKCRDSKEMKKEPIPIRRPQRRSNLLPQPPSLAQQPSLQPDPKCHLCAPQATALRSQALSPHLDTGKVPPKPTTAKTMGTSPLEEVSKRSSLLPPKHAARSSGLCLVLLPKHSRLCQFGLQHKYCATADSSVPIMVILQVTMRMVFLIVCGHVLLPLICDLDEEKFSQRKFC